ncbi:MAG: FAD-binding protein [Promethearchaeota archaeon]
MGIKIDTELCTGCGNCISLCPYNGIKLVKNKAQITSECSACGLCVEECPAKAIVIEKNDVSIQKTDISQYKGVWVIGEHFHNKIENVVYELIGKGRELADKLDINLTVVILGSQLDNKLEEFSEYGVDEVIYVTSSILEDYYLELYVNILTNLIKENKPEIILIGATPIGRDFAPRISKRLNIGLTADCTGLDIDPECKNLLQTRPTFGGNIMATIKTPHSRPQMSTVRPGVFKPCKKMKSNVRIRKINYNFNRDDLITKIVKIIKRKKDKVQLEDAEIIVAGGRGVGSKENFKIIKKLAKVLNAEVAGSRVAVDLNWISSDRQIGQTGKIVSPKLYIACGISGASQHLVGIQCSDIIVAINKDPNASIFEIAHYGIVGDLHKVIPELIKEIKRIKYEEEISN